MTNPLIVAEAGVNHNGSLETALQLVDTAAAAGADVVKFQTFDVDETVTADAPQATYQRERAAAPTQRDMLRGLVLDRGAHERIAERCAEQGIEFLSTAFDEGSFRWLLDLGIRRVKVGSGELTNGPLLLAFARSGLPILLSTGMARLGEIEDALSVIAFGLASADGDPSPRDLHEAYGRAIRDGTLQEHVTLLHCTSSYPARPEDVHLAAMGTLAQAFALRVGYSDHTLGIPIAFAAIARGAVVLEKHFTLDRTGPGPDHAASLEPAELADLVAGARAISAAIGRPAKYPTLPERDTAAVARRSIVAGRAIARGEVFATDNLKALRPATGRSPMELWALLGREASRDYRPQELIDPTE
jgi:N-acetylneuraminate synthase